MTVVAEPQAAEAIAQSYRKEAPTAPVPPEQQRAIDRGAEIRQRMDAVKDSDPLSALSKNGEVKSTEDITKKREGNEKNLGKRFGTEVKPPTPGSPEADRLQKAQELHAAMQKLEDKGMSELSDPEKKTMQDAVMEHAFKGRAVFDAMSEDDKRAIADGLLDRPEVRAQLTDILEGKLKPEDADKTITEALDRAQKNKENTEAEFVTKRDESRRLNTEFTDKKREQRGFEDKPDGSPGALQQELDDLESNEGYLKYRTSDAMTYLDRLGMDDAGKEALFNKVKADIAAGNIPSYLDGFSSDQDIAMAEIIQYGEQINRLDHLRARKVALPGEIAALQAERTRVRGELGDAITKNTEADVKLTEATDAKAEHDEQVIRNMESAAGDAVDKFLESDLAERRKISDEIYKEERAKAESEDEKNILDAIHNRWEKEEYKKGRLVSTIDKKQVREDWGLLMKGGPKEVMRDMLHRKMDTIKFPVGTPQYQEELARINSQVDKLYDDHKFQIANELATNFIIIGGKPLPDEVRMLRKQSNAEWGGGSVMEWAKTNQEALMRDLEDLNNKGKLEYKGVMNRITRNAKKGSVFAALAILLTGGMAGAIKDAAMQRQSEF